MLSDHSLAQHLIPDAVIRSPLPEVPWLGLVERDGQLQQLLFLQHKPQVGKTNDSSKMAEWTASLHDYLYQGIPLPMLPWLPEGTPFQQRVWRALQQIPHGAQRRYGELAVTLGSSPRAVASACRANPLPLFFPCHRVVAANSLGGYMGMRDGYGLAIKQWLLQHENDNE